MKVECPYCWQHYEVSSSDMKRELVCVNCEQTFRVQDALVIDTDNTRKYTPWILWGLSVLVVLLTVLNIWIWQSATRVSGPESQQPRKQDLQTELSALHQTLNDFRKENERIAKALAEQDRSRQDLTMRLETLEKKLAVNSNAANQQTSINALSDRLEKNNDQIKLLTEYHAQLLKGLTALRIELQAMDIASRLTELEKKQR